MIDRQWKTEDTLLFHELNKLTNFISHKAEHLLIILDDLEFIFIDTFCAYKIIESLLNKKDNKLRQVLD